MGELMRRSGLGALLLAAAPDGRVAVQRGYHLWSAPPDAELRKSDLSKPEVLAAQTNRLLDDPRSEGFLTAFVHQWLGLDRIDFFEVNRALYPRFDTGTKVAAKGEIHETIAHILKHNASLRDLLKADYVVINRVLAHYYGINGVKGVGYEKVSLPKDSPRAMETSIILRDRIREQPFRSRVVGMSVSPMNPRLRRSR